MIKTFTGSRIRSCKSYYKFTYALNNWNITIGGKKKHITIEQYVQKKVRHLFSATNTYRRIIVS